MKYTHGTAWLAPFTEAAAPYVPLRKLELVRGYKIRYHGQDVTEGQCLTADHKKFTITLATHLNIDGRAKRRMIANILQTYAHELAHLKHWDHTPEHWELESTIAKRFAKLLQKMGIKDTTKRKV